MAFEATADAGFVYEVVMAGYAVDGGVLFVGEVHREEGWGHCWLQ
jgi:hypothetical protein